jgi:hypothetical protein
MVVITSLLSTGLSNASVPSTNGANDPEGLLHMQAVVLLGMATPEETMTSARNQDDKRGSDSSLAAFLYESS